MTKKQKMAIVIAAGLALAGVGGGYVIAGSPDDDLPLRGSSYEKATEAALDHVGGGTVIETEDENGDDGAAYSVEVRGEDGNVVEVNLDESFDVIGSENDDDASEDRDEGEDSEGD